MVGRRHGPSPRALANPQIRAVVGTAKWTVGQHLGDLHVVETADEGRLVGHLGPDVLGRTGTPSRPPDAYVPATTIAAALLDQRNLAGVGTWPPQRPSSSSA